MGQILYFCPPKTVALQIHAPHSKLNTSKWGVLYNRSWRFSYFRQNLHFLALNKRGFVFFEIIS